MKKLKGFTLLELLLVIAIIAIIASILFVALDPLTRFKDSRDARRWSEVTEILHAIKLDQVDNGGSYASAVSGLTNGQVYMIGTAGSACNTTDAGSVSVTCSTAVTQAACIDLESGTDDIVSGGYLGDIPVSPDSTVNTWDATKTGYTIQKDSTGILYVRACLEEGSKEIEVSR